MNKAILYVLFAWLAFFGPATAHAQSETRITHRKIMFPGETHHFYVMDQHASVEVNNRVIYWWFKNNSVHQTQGGYDGLLIDGPYVIYYANNDLKEKGEFSKGRRNGNWKSWHTNGNLKTINTWKYGELHGSSTQFDSTGKLVQQSGYRYGQKHGLFITHSDTATVQEQYNRGVLKVKKLKVKKDKVKKEKAVKPEETKPVEIVPETNPEDKKPVTTKEKRKKEKAIKKEARPSGEIEPEDAERKKMKSFRNRKKVS
ncbi:MAG: hypothetical protein V4616_08570 [Bacteroidota bacterium]